MKSVVGKYIFVPLVEAELSLLSICIDRSSFGAVQQKLDVLCCGGVSVNVHKKIQNMPSIKECPH